MSYDQIRRDKKGQQAMATHAPDISTQSRLLARMEHQKSYASNQAAIAALELTTALSKVLTRKFGQQFSDEMCAELAQRATALRSDDFISQCTANIVGELAEWPMWKPQD